jgi:hypothetical protein
LEKAFAVLRVPSLGLWSARALAQQNKLLEAVERYLETSRLPVSGGDVEVQKRAKADALAESDATQALIPSIVITVAGADGTAVTLKVDGESVSSRLVGEAMPLNPGSHRVEGELAGELVVSELSLERKEQRQVPLQFKGAAKPSPAPVAASAVAVDTDSAAPSSVTRTLGWVALGTGVAGLVVGGVSAGLAASKRSTLDSDPNCADHRCPQSFESDVNSYNSLRLVSTVGFVAGGVLSVTGGVLLLTQRSSSEPTSASLWLSPGRVELRGQF